jgi:hypothetical protein
MPPLAIGVVGQEIEQSYREQVGLPILVERKVVDLVIGIDIELKGTKPVRAIPKNGWGYQRPAERPTDGIGGHLSQTQRTVGKVPERSLALMRLVDR